MIYPYTYRRTPPLVYLFGRGKSKFIIGHGDDWTAGVFGIYVLPFYQAPTLERPVKPPTIHMTTTII